MARILLIGGHGKVALLTAPLLVRDGHAVDAVVRNPDHREDVAETGAIPIVADVESLDTEALVELVADHDVVVWSAGAGGGNPERTYAVDRDAAIRSVDAAVRAGVLRYVMVSYFGAGPDHGVPETEGFFHYAEAKAAADAHLRGSDLEWVVLGPSRLTDEPGTGSVTAPRSLPAKDSVSRADVAAVIAGVVARPEVSRVTWEFNNGDTPVDEALAALS
ncbi:MAG TPA: NAD(P)-binding oxidoreductase [Nocardioides sp.]